MTPYTLTLMAPNPETWDKCFMSADMIGKSLIEQYRLLAAEGEVEIKGVVDPVLDKTAEGVPECDVMLVHHFFAQGGREFSFDPNALKQRVKCLALFLELGAGNADISFTYIRDLWHSTPAWVVIPQPYLPEFTVVEDKMPRTILLDHDYPIDRTVAGWEEFKRTGHGNCDEIYKICEGYLDKFEFYQLERCAQIREHKPKWLKLIPHMGYADYMRLTANIETFICTHSGSYNHTVVDMATRGTRVVTVAGYIPPDLATNIHAYSVSSVQELRNIFDYYDKLTPVVPEMNNCTPMHDAVRIMHKKFQAYLERGGRS